MLMPYILPLIWNFISAMAFIGGLTFCIALTTAGNEIVTKSQSNLDF